MLQLDCPWCGPRDEIEFGYGGERAARPDATVSSDDAWSDYLFYGDNARGIIREHWVHSHGCEQWFVVSRHTATNEIAATWPVAAVPGV